MGLHYLARLTSLQCATIFTSVLFRAAFRYTHSMVSGFRVSGFRVFGFGVWGLRVKSLGFRAWGLAFLILGLRV